MNIMLRPFARILAGVAFAAAAQCAMAFSLLGPYATWETPALSYNIGGGTGGQALDIGGPMNLGEGYRWNIQTVTYGFDKSFQDYFGTRGMDEVNKAFAILNALPPVSKMSSNLTEFPQDTRRINYAANSIGLVDLKSWVLGMIVEQMGLTDPERYVWTLRNRFVTPAPVTNYFVIMRNFDPVTWIPSAYVDGVLYSYTIVEFGTPTAWADAVETTVDPLALPWRSVAGVMMNGNIADNPTLFAPGFFFTGLTRDDVGGLRYLLRKQNINMENLATNAIASGGGSAWGVAGGGGALVSTALRGGVDKINFKLIKYYGPFPGFTNFYTDKYYTNGHTAQQRIERDLASPDIIFTAGDLGTFGGSGVPVLKTRTDTTTWNNNSAINTPPRAGVELDGPGVIPPPVVLALSTVGPYIVNRFPGFLDQADPLPASDPIDGIFGGMFGGWAAFDGTTNAPYIFPNGASIQQLQQMVFSNGGQ